MTIRTRLALVLAVSLVAAGALALTINFVAFQRAPYRTWWDYSNELLAEMHVSRETVERSVADDPTILFGTPGETKSWNGVSIDEASRAVQERAIKTAVARSRLLTAVAIALVGLGALAAGWLLARRILEPIREITRRARLASATAPGGPIALDGPNDEIKHLADTFDEMLARIGSSHAAQRRFASQVSHELRTPLATIAIEADLLITDLEDPGARRRVGSIAEATRRAERLIGRLLVLSRTELDDLERVAFDFDELVGNVLGQAVEGDSWMGLRLDFELANARVEGDRALLETLVRNLVENAARHNRPGGWVTLAVGADAGGQAVLTISNSTRGPFSAPGTGLSIVRAVAEAHGATVDWTHTDESVSARVSFPVVNGALRPSPSTHANSAAPTSTLVKPRSADEGRCSTHSGQMDNGLFRRNDV